MSDETTNSAHAAYTVVARRYRPRTFGELIGQEHIAQALSKAIASGRVGHAYLFTGARGVGKTSTARIFAKALNAESNVEAGDSDIAQAIDAGEDIDVIEIDGASNRGIEEIRQLRANVTVRPSRARFKIYIIDEVHMLTNQAFNALLKTLEEPPEHVKFIFCTTDPDKIPITVLSRCQRFDFVPVKFDAIQRRLKEISLAEGYQADDEALGLLARKAAGSMRDSQSLLEQVMSFSTDIITVEQVHALLGTADEGRLLEVAEALRDRSALNALAVVEKALRGGSDPGQLAEQLLNYFRDVMTAGIGGGPELLRMANPAGHANLKTLAEAWGVPTIVSAIQILDESLVRMRSSISAATLLEVALVQICQLQNLALIPAILEAFAQGGPIPSPVTARPAPASTSPAVSSSPEKKNVSTVAAAMSEPLTGTTAAPETAQSGHLATTTSAQPPVAVSVRESVAPPVVAKSESNPPIAGDSSRALPAPAASTTATGGSSQALDEWRRAVSSIDGMLADFAGMAESIEPQGSDQWTVTFPPGAHKPREYCEHSERRSQLQQALQKTLGRLIRLSFVVRPGQPVKIAEAVPQTNQRVQKMREVAENPLIKKLVDVLGCEIVRVDQPSHPTVPKAQLASERVS